MDKKGNSYQVKLIDWGNSYTDKSQKPTKISTNKLNNDNNDNTTYIMDNINIIRNETNKKILKMKEKLKCNNYALCLKLKKCSSLSLLQLLYHFYYRQQQL